MTFAEKVDELLTKHHVSWRRVASDCGLSHNSLYYWRKTGNLPKYAELRILADYFGVTTEYLSGLNYQESEALSILDEPPTHQGGVCIETDNDKQLLILFHKMTPDHQEKFLSEAIWHLQ